MLTLLGSCMFGALLGLRHALEPDHLAAISTLAVDPDHPWQGLRLGATWGLGHTLALLTLGGALAVFEAQMPAQISGLLELAVAAMIIGLGIRALIWAFRGGGLRA